MYHIEQVGIIHNDTKSVAKGANARNSVSTIEIHEAFVEGLFMIETCAYLDVLFYFHKSNVQPTESSSLRGRIITGEEKGVFASRSPRRPNAIGVTTVRLLGRDGNRLKVTGLDAIDGTPVVDIKASDSSHQEYGELTEIHTAMLKSNPRISIWKHIMAGDTEKLLLQAGQIHGHYCPGLAMGVMAATTAMQEARTDSDGLEDLLAIVETNNCFSDGVQLVTGCSFGNNSLIFHDLGKTAFTLTQRNGNGFRVISRPDSQAYISDCFPEFDERYKRVVKQGNRNEKELVEFKKYGIERAFGVLKLDFDKLFHTSSIKVEIPDYAPSHESVICRRCGESVMANRVIDSGDGKLCLSCSSSAIAQLDGHGIRQNIYDR
ncbi:MAG: tRNA (N6-threonylcarbamoyladenosine(37)-N6)-methyltransferase TrmO [Balneolales bacterium]